MEAKGGEGGMKEGQVRISDICGYGAGTVMASFSLGGGV